MRTTFDGRLVLDAENWKLIQEANRAGNKIAWRSDKQTWGVEERWTFPKEIMPGKMVEDCDGISLWKMRELIKRGVPESCILMTICRCETGEGHAVICVATDRGDFILDNRFVQVKTYDDLKKHGYEFLFRSRIGADLDDPWERIQD